MTRRLLILMATVSTIFLVAIVPGAAEAKSPRLVRITLAEMIRWHNRTGEGCMIVYAITNDTSRHISEILLSFSGANGHFFSDKIHDIARRAKLERFHNDPMATGDVPAAKADCRHFAETLIDIVEHRQGPQIAACVVDKTPEPNCRAMVEIEIGPRFLESAGNADEHPADF